MDFRDLRIMIGEFTQNFTIESGEYSATSKGDLEKAERILKSHYNTVESEGVEDDNMYLIRFSEPKELLGESMDNKFPTKSDLNAAKFTIKWSDNIKEIKAAQEVIRRYKEQQENMKKVKEDINTKYWVQLFYNWKKDPDTIKYFDNVEDARAYANKKAEESAYLSKIYLGKTDEDGMWIIDSMTLLEGKERFNEAIEKHEELNPKLWNGQELKPEVKEKLREIVQKFDDNLKENGVELDVEDICIIGSNANYNYSSDSDIDLHIVADTSVYPDQEELAMKVYLAYKSLFNNKYDPTINGVEVEIYVEPDSIHANSNGIYSLEKGWLKEPEQVDVPEIDPEHVQELIQPYEDRYNEIVSGEPTIEEVDKLIDDIYLQRQQSIAKDGEFADGNICFKEFRNRGYLQKLRDLKVELENKEMSLGVVDNNTDDQMGTWTDDIVDDIMVDEKFNEGWGDHWTPFLDMKGSGKDVILQSICDWCKDRPWTDPTKVLRGELIDNGSLSDVDEFELKNNGLLKRVGNGWEYYKNGKRVWTGTTTSAADCLAGDLMLESVISHKKKLKEDLTELENGIEFDFPNPHDTLAVYLSWEGIIGFDEDIIEFYEDGGYDALSDYLDEEGIWGYTERIAEILNGEPAYCHQMEMEDFLDVCRHLYIDPSLAMTEEWDGDINSLLSKAQMEEKLQEKCDLKEDTLPSNIDYLMRKYAELYWMAADAQAAKESAVEYHRYEEARPWDNLLSKIYRKMFELEDDLEEIDPDKDYNIGSDGDGINYVTKKHYKGNPYLDWDRARKAGIKTDYRYNSDVYFDKFVGNYRKPKSIGESLTEDIDVDSLDIKLKPVIKKVLGDREKEFIETIVKMILNNNDYLDYIPHGMYKDDAYPEDHTDVNGKPIMARLRKVHNFWLDNFGLDTSLRGVSSAISDAMLDIMHKIEKTDEYKATLDDDATDKLPESEKFKIGLFYNWDVEEVKNFDGYRDEDTEPRSFLQYLKDELKDDYYEDQERQWIKDAIKELEGGSFVRGGLDEYDEDFGGAATQMGDMGSFKSFIMNLSPEKKKHLTEKIVKNGSKYQVQSEKGRNMGTYDTKKKAEDRLKDVEMFKHMNEGYLEKVTLELDDDGIYAYEVGGSTLENKYGYYQGDVVLEDDISQAKLKELGIKPGDKFVVGVNDDEDNTVTILSKINESLTEAKKVGLVSAAKWSLRKANEKLKDASLEEVYNHALKIAGMSEYPFVKNNLEAKKDEAIEFIKVIREAEWNPELDESLNEGKEENLINKISSWCESHGVHSNGSDGNLLIFNGSFDNGSTMTVSYDKDTKDMRVETYDGETGEVAQRRMTVLDIGSRSYRPGKMIDLLNFSWDCLFEGVDESLDEGTAFDTMPGYMTPEEVRAFNREKEAKAKAEKDAARAAKAAERKERAKAERARQKRIDQREKVNNLSYDSLADMAGLDEDNNDLTKDELLAVLRSSMSDEEILKMHKKMFEGCDPLSDNIINEDTWGDVQNRKDTERRTTRMKRGNPKKDFPTKQSKPFKDGWTYDVPLWDTTKNTGTRDELEYDMAYAYADIIFKYFKDHNIKYVVEDEYYEPSLPYLKLKLLVEDQHKMEIKLNNDYYGDLGSHCKAWASVWNKDTLDGEGGLSAGGNSFNDLIRFFDRFFEKYPTNGTKNESLVYSKNKKSYNRKGYKKMLNEARYSDVVPKEDRKYWYFTTHGQGPGTIPNDVNLIDVKYDLPNRKGTIGDYICLDAVLNTSELKKYDLTELTPPDMLTEDTVTMDKGTALANYLDVDPDEINYEYDDVYSYGNEEYVVATEDEAYDLAVQDIKDLFDDMGLDSFTESFRDWIVANAVDEDYIDELIDGEIDYYENEEGDQETADYLRGLEYYDKIDYFLGIYGNDLSWLEDHIDLDKVALEAISEDGVAHFISFYDGKEIDLGDGLYAYRIN